MDRWTNYNSQDGRGEVLQMPKQTKEEKAQDKLIEASYYKFGHGVQINIFDIPRIFQAGRYALDNGQDLDAAIQAAIANLRQN